MKNRWILASAVLLALSHAGCETKTRDTDLHPKGPLNLAQRPTNVAIIQGYENEHVNLAIIRQHTLYPYHFENNSASFNELGWRDIRVLSAHFVSNPGPLNVRKGDTPDVLYKARVKAVVDAMTDAGVKSDRIKVNDGLPGGDGISSDQVVVILERMRTQTASTGQESSGSGSMDNQNGSPTGTPQSTGVGTRAGGPK